MEFLTQEDYYEVGTIDDIVISQSSLKMIDPKRGGSPRKFKSWFVERLDKPSTAMLRGTIFHKYAEDRENFKVSEAVKPSEKLGIVADAVMNAYNALEDEQSQSEFMMMIDSNVVSACRAVGWNPSWGDAAIIKNTTMVVSYVNAMNDPSNKGKIILTAKMKEDIERCIESLKQNEYAHKLLFWKDPFSTIDYYKELEVYWEEEIDGVKLKCKAKLDDTIINHETKEIDINDLKTYGGSAHNYQVAFIDRCGDIQLQMYKRAVLAKFPQYANYKFNYRNIVVETQGEFETVVHRYHESIIGEASFLLDQLLRRVVSAKATGFRMSMEEIAGKGEIRHKELERK